MPEIKNHPPGSFCWAEVGTIDAKKTKAFYSELFGWKYEDKPAGEFGVYTMCKLAGKDLAGLYELPPELRKAGLPAHWMAYLAVTSADDTCAKIVKHGGRIQQKPFDVMDVGRMAICQDPTGATFSVWQPLAHKGASVMGENGTPCWFELTTKGLEKAETFYREVFGWSVKGGSDAGFVYREFSAPGVAAPQGGMKELAPHDGPTPPNWMIYFTVEDCDGDVQRAQRLGGKIVVPALEVPKVGRIAVLADPAGAVFAIITLALDPGHKQGSGAKPAAKEAATPKGGKKK